MKNIYLLNDSFPPLIDGVANTVVNYARVISSYGTGVSVVTPDYPGADDSASVILSSGTRESICPGR